MTDARLFEAFVRKYQDMVFATAVRLLGNRADAEDVAQTVFLRAFQRFEAVASNPGAPGWLRTVTTNVCLNHLSRYRSRWRLFSELSTSDENPCAALDTASGVVESAADTFERTDRNRRLEDGLRQLPDRQRVPLVLFHFEGRRYDEIAAVLGVSIGKVKTDIHRGREALRKIVTTPHD